MPDDFHLNFAKKKIEVKSLENVTKNVYKIGQRRFEARECLQIPFENNNNTIITSLEHSLKCPSRILRCLFQQQQKKMKGGYEKTHKSGEKNHIVE